MATTNLIVDFLVIGLVGSVWLSPILLLTMGSEWLQALGRLGVGAILPMLGFAYILGIAVSRVADDSTDWWNDKWRDQVFGKNVEPSYHNRLNYIISTSGTASEYLSYRRSVIRTSRACAINFVLGCLMWLVTAIISSKVVPWRLAAPVAGLSFLLALFLFRAWSIVLKGYFNSVKDMHKCLSKDPSKQGGCIETDESPTRMES